MIKKLLIGLVLACFTICFAGEKAPEQGNEKYFNTCTVDIWSGGAKLQTSYPVKKRKDGAWRVRIPKEDISQAIDYIDIKIPACQAKKGEEGYFINTQSAIGTFREDNGVYTGNGRNYYAFFGMKNPRVTWMCIVKKLRHEFDMVAEAKDGVYNVFPRFNIKKMEVPAYEDIVVDFYELTGDDANYSGMARKYRQYQLDRGEVKPLKERIKNNPKLEAMAKSILIRSQHGGKPMPRDKRGRYIIKDYTVETELPMNVACTCDQVTETIKALKAAGCDNLVFHEVGWNISGHDGRYPQLFPVEPKIGGEEALKRTIETAKSLGYYISPHVNHTDAYRIADCWSEDYIAKRADGSLMYVGAWAGGKAYTPCPDPIFDLFVKDGYPEIYNRLGFNGLHHVDVISAIAPRVCHDKKHPLNRKQWTQAYLRIMKYAHKITGGFTSECGFDHVIKYLDWAFYINHQNRHHKMLDRYIPIWQIVYHGIVPSAAFYSDTNNNLNKDWPTIRLHHAEFGGRPVYYTATNVKNVPKIKEFYDEYQKVAHLQLEFMQEHKKLADDVYLTVYGDGSRVVTNYTNAPYEFEGKKVAAMDYLLIPGEAKN